MSRVRAKPEHTTMKKIDEIFELMDELKIRFWVEYGVFKVSDGEHVWELRENEDEPVYELPSTMEWKITRNR